MFASSEWVSGIAHRDWVTVEQYEGDVPAPWDAADLHSQSHLYDRQRHELRCRDLVHPASHAFGGITGGAYRVADSPLACAVALYRRAHRPRGPSSPDVVARLRARGHNLLRR